mmetsp:Transcript_45129/g.111916  ORF Transcript_45129/g.111916 Transcript_45129/m.111916 type:complete len:296 (-) Transcript_45129:14-901(-)
MDSKRATPWRRGSGRGILTLLANLPLGLLALIAGFLGLDDEFLAALVCRQFHAAVMSTRQREGRETSTTLIRSVVHRLRKFQWAVSCGLPLGAGLFVRLAEGGLLPQLRYLRSSTLCEWDERTCTAASSRGNLNVLRWARDNGCPWDAQTSHAAAEGGHLNLLRWARRNGCSFNWLTCWPAARGGHLGVLRWARANGCAWNASTCFGAAETGHLSVLMWARFNGCGWDERVTLAAEHGGHSHVYAWAVANGCPTPPGKLTGAGAKYRPYHTTAETLASGTGNASAARTPRERQII